MKKYLLWLLMMISIVASTEGNSQTIHPEVPRIDAQMAFYIYKQGNVILIDAMGPETFAKKHILGSINIRNDGPQDIERVRNMELPFPKDKNILVYCM